MRSTEAVITEIVEAYNCRWGQWVRVAEIAAKVGLTREELAAALETLMDEDETFRAEPEPFGHRVTAEDRAVAPVIGGEARHLICWYS
ncbi:hypothetical protein [Actinoplanes sp. NPDC049599]|uniref:hypothetical protein n=1 Tax=Actinoplanes sp. NPDC049599 TaxID=3363903 RepID=UPI0037A02CD6